MNLYTFVNSRDISKHLEDINYQFSAIEAAWLIYQSTKKSISEKKEAWEWIMSNMPDEEVPERINCIHRDSLHQTIKEYMQLIDKYQNIFETAENNAVFRFVLYFSDDRKEFDSLFIELSQCIEIAKNEVSHYEEKPECIGIIKQYFGVNEKTISEYFDSEMNLIYIDSPELNEFVWDFFEGMWFKFPTPFKKGDILTMVGVKPYRRWDFHMGSFVMEGGMFMPEMQPKLPPNGDTTDMTAWGYFVDEEGIIFDDTIWNYMDLEYERKKMIGRERILYSISSFMKEEIDLGLLLNAQRNFIGESIDMKDYIENLYLKERLEYAGIRKE